MYMHAQTPFQDLTPVYTHTVALFLPLVVVLIIVFFVSMSLFAHYRYPHVSYHGRKRHRKPP